MTTASIVFGAPLPFRLRERLRVNRRNFKYTLFVFNELDARKDIQVPNARGVLLLRFRPPACA